MVVKNRSVRYAAIPSANYLVQLICQINYCITVRAHNFFSINIFKNPIGVCPRSSWCIWSHKYLCLFTLFVYNTYFLCDHTPYRNNYTSV